MNVTRTATRNDEANGIIMIRDYNNFPLEDMDMDPLNYWDVKRKSRVMPTVKKFFCVPGTSVPSEKLFSKAGELISAKRSRLGKRNVDMLLFISKNL